VLGIAKPVIMNNGNKQQVEVKIEKQRDIFREVIILVQEP
jgi:hypothetical protein